MLEPNPQKVNYAYRSSDQTPLSFYHFYKIALILGAIANLSNINVMINGGFISHSSGSSAFAAICFLTLAVLCVYCSVCLFKRMWSGVAISCFLPIISTATSLALFGATGIVLVMLGVVFSLLLWKYFCKRRLLFTPTYTQFVSSVEDGETPENAPKKETME